MPIEINGVRVELIDAILIKRKSGRKPGNGRSRVDRRFNERLQMICSTEQSAGIIVSRGFCSR